MTFENQISDRQKIRFVFLRERKHASYPVLISAETPLILISAATDYPIYTPRFDRRQGDYEIFTGRIILAA